MLQIILLLIISFLCSFLLNLWLLPYFIKVHRKKELLAQDMNKLEKPKVPTLGGLTMVCSFIIAIFVVLVLENVLNLSFFNDELFLPALLSIFIIALVGFVDDILLFPFRPIKPLLALVASIPLTVLFLSKSTEVTIPYLGSINLSLIYAFILIPLIFIFVSNAINIMADFDGLVPGNGLIMSACLFFLSFYNKQFEAALIFITLLAGLVVFYQYNRFPAKIFSGNVGTLFVGGTLAAGAIIAHLKYALFFLMIPYLIHFFLQERYIFEKKNIFARPRERGLPQKDGTIKSQYKKSFGLTHFIMIHFKKATERKLVYLLFGLELSCSLAAILFYLFIPR